MSVQGASGLRRRGVRVDPHSAEVMTEPWLEEVARRQGQRPAGSSPGGDLGWRVVCRQRRLCSPRSGQAEHMVGKTVRLALGPLLGITDGGHGPSVSGISGKQRDPIETVHAAGRGEATRCKGSPDIRFPRCSIPRSRCIYAHRLPMLDTKFYFYHNSRESSTVALRQTEDHAAHRWDRSFPMEIFAV
jgi:hypothetical protein